MIKNYLSALLLFLAPLGAFAQIFEVDGIYYNVTSADDKTCEVTYGEPSSGTGSDSDEPVVGQAPTSSNSGGDVEIPSYVEYDGTMYSVTSIGDYAFRLCSGLTSVNIPNSVTSIGMQAFYHCYGLTSVNIPNSVTSIGNYAFEYCSGLKSVTIPNSVTSIGDCAFWNCTSLSSVNIPESVTSIGGKVFVNCTSLTSMTIPASVTIMNDALFQDCSGLTSVNILGSVTSIGDNVFNGCTNLEALTIPSSVTSIGVNAFMDCKRLTSLTIPSSVTSISNYAFRNCSGLKSLTILGPVTSIGNYAFYGCSGLTSLTIPSSVTSIGNYAFYGCSGLTSLTIPASVTSIGDYTFCNCYSLESLTIPSSVTSIGVSAFNSCISLTSLTIPASVTSIGNTAFPGDLTRLECLAEVPPTCEAYAFDGMYIRGCELVVPEGSIGAYQSAEVWKDFPNISGTKVYNVPIDALGYVTRCFADNVDLSGTGLTAYVVSTYDDATAMLTEVTGVVPSSEGVILYAAYPGTYSLFPSEAGATDANLEGNKLMGVMADTNLEPGAAYVLAADGADGVEFALLSDDAGSDGGNVVPANRAYLPVNATGFAAPQTLSFTFGTPTAIESVTVTADDAEVMWYTLSGVPVKNPSKGIFVNNKGKVVLFK